MKIKLFVLQIHVGSMLFQHLVLKTTIFSKLKDLEEDAKNHSNCCDYQYMNRNHIKYTGCSVKGTVLRGKNNERNPMIIRIEAVPITASFWKFL